MITSDIVEIEFTKDNRKIETILRQRGIEPLRWAIVSVLSDKLVISVSYEV